MRCKYFLALLLPILFLTGCGDNTTKKSQVQEEEPAALQFQPERELTGHQGGINRLLFSPDGRYIYSVGYSDYSLRVWDPGTGSELVTRQTPKRIRGLAITPDGTGLYTGDAYKNLDYWPLNNGLPEKLENLDKKAGDFLTMHPEGKYIAFTAYQHPVLLWDIPKRQTIKVLGEKPDRRILCFSPSGNYLAAGGRGNSFSIWDAKKWREKRYPIKKVGKDSEVTSIDISMDDKYMATGHNDSSIVIFDFKKRREIHNFFVADASTHQVLFSPDGQTLATAHQNGNVYLWDVTTAKLYATLSGHGDAVTALAFSPDSSIVASGGDDRKILIWRMNQDQTQAIIEAATESATESAPKSAQTPDPNYQPELIEIDGIANLIGDNNAAKPTPVWTSEGETRIEPGQDGNNVFAVRYGGSFWQEFKLEESTGRFALLVAWASSERINPGGEQTGLPYLHGYMLSKDASTQTTKNLQGQQLMLSASSENEWGILYGIFEIPPDTGSIRFFMQQADGKQAQNGSYARFDEPGIFIFDSEEEALKFMREY